DSAYGIASVGLGGAATLMIETPYRTPDCSRPDAHPASLAGTVAPSHDRGILGSVTRHALLHTAQLAAYARVRARLDGLTDDEFFWQPVPDCWTIYEEPGSRWTYHYAEPDPQPAPVTTVGWQLVHLATCK